MWRNSLSYNDPSPSENVSGVEPLFAGNDDEETVNVVNDGHQEIHERRRRTTTISSGLNVPKTICGRVLLICRSVVTKIGEDWLHLVLLGVLMGVFSFTIDLTTAKLREMHFYVSRLAGTVHWFLQYATWVLYSLSMVIVSSTLCHYFAPQAAGSGIPEMKTILRGVVLKEYLTCKTLATKFVGLVLALGSDLPLGKEGPFVHIASMLARLLSKLVVSFQGIYENESRSSEMMAAACAVGIASTYGAPVGGVLFSIEVTSVFFPLRNYWRGFLSTVCSAITFRLLLVWSKHTDTVVAFSVTNFPSDYPFDPKELVFFALIGISCGFAGALFVWTHHKYVRYVLHNPRIKRIMQKYFFIYPAAVTLLIASLKCPFKYGNYFAGGLTPREAVRNLSSNFSWIDPVENDSSVDELLSFWRPEGTSSIFLVLFLFVVNMFWMTFLANTIPVPCGVFIPVFVTGAAFGRLIGEALYVIFPNGVRTDGVVTKLVPGAYALVGATAFAGAVTHAISTSVIVVEMTGQILYILPLTLAVLLANAVCSRLQPSIYDSVIKLKKLPYLPQIPPTSSSVHRLYVADFAVRDVKFLSLSSTYGEMRSLLHCMPKLKAFPLVDAPSSRILLGSIRRSRLDRLLEAHIGQAARAKAVMIFRLGVREKAMDEDEKKTNNEDCLQLVAPKLLVNGNGIGIGMGSGNGSAAGDIDADHAQSRFLVRRVRSCDTLSAPPTPLAESTMHHSQPGPEGNYHTVSVEPRRSRSFLLALGNYMQELLPQKLRRSLRRQSPEGAEASPSELMEWEKARLDERIDFDRLKVDPAPFQLVERTSLHKAHSLFWILGLNRAYVTCLGRLVGVVALRELRQALEHAHVNEPTRPLSRGLSATPTNVNSDGPLAKLRTRFGRGRRPMPGSLARHASTTTSASLVPGQAETLHVITFSLPSTPQHGWQAGGDSMGDHNQIERSLIEETACSRTRAASSVSVYENAHGEEYSSSEEEIDFVSYSTASETGPVVV